MRSSSGRPLGGLGGAAGDDLAVGVQHLDADLEQVRVEVLDLLLGDLRLLEHPDDLVVGEEALLPPVDDERRISSTSGRAISTALRPDGCVVARTPSSSGGWAGASRCDYTGARARARRRGVRHHRRRAHIETDEASSPMSTTRRTLPDDLQQSRAGGSDQPLPGRRHPVREGHPHPPQRRRAALPRGGGVLLRPEPRAEGRAHVALRGGGQRGHRRRRHRRGADHRGARRADRDQAGRQPAGAAQRGDDPGQLPGREAHAGHRHPHPGDVRADRHRRGEPRDQPAPRRRHARRA